MVHSSHIINVQILDLNPKKSIFLCSDKKIFHITLQYHIYSQIQFPFDKYKISPNYIVQKCFRTNIYIFIHKYFVNQKYQKWSKKKEKWILLLCFPLKRKNITRNSYNFPFLNKKIVQICFYLQQTRCLILILKAQEKYFIF